MSNLHAPGDFRTEAGDECVKIHFTPVEDADGYIISFYKPDQTDTPFKTRYAEKPGKKIRGFKNGENYLASVCAYVLDDNDNEDRGEASEKNEFTPYNDTLKTQTKLCLRQGEQAKIKCDYNGSTPYVSFASNNPSVATVDDNGLVRAIAPGEADIITSMPGELYSVTSVSVNRSLSPLKTSFGRILITGDLMCTVRQQKQASVYGYDFLSDMEIIKSRFNNADHIIGNLETMLYDGAPYESEQIRTESGSPNANSPSTFLDALKYAGFDVIVTANNHNCDCGIIGLKETVSLIKRSGMNNSGTYYDNPVYMYSAGIKVALISLNMISNGLEKEMYIAVDGRTIGSYSSDYCKELIHEAKINGAEFIIVMMHWGRMNSHSITKAQKETAAFIAESGADLIVGAHPHLVQKACYIETSDNRRVPCAYSLGNFLTGMDELTGNRDSAVFVLDLAVIDGQIESRYSYVPFYSRLLPEGLSVEPVNSPHGYEQYKSAMRTMRFMGDDIPVYKPGITCYGSVILRRLFKDSVKYNVSLDNVLLTPASFFGGRQENYTPTEYARVNLDISKCFWDKPIDRFNEYCVIDFYAAASLNLLKLGDDYYTASDAFMLSGFYKSHESEFTLIEQPTASDICATYLEKFAGKLLSIYDSHKIILIRQHISSVSAVEDTLRYKKSYKALNNRIEWLEDLFMIYAHPTVIDISSDYFADNTYTESVSEFESYYYTDVLNILDNIISKTRFGYFKTLNADSWFARVIKYYDSLKENGRFEWICKEQDAADALVINTSRSFLSSHSSEIIYLKKNRIQHLEDVSFIGSMSSELIDRAGEVLSSIQTQPQP